MIGKLWNEFKAFAFQGNMIELAVAVVIGGAFGGVIHSLVGDVIMPTVAYIIHTGEQVAEKAKDAAESVTGHPSTAPTTAPTTTADTAPAAGAPPAAMPAATPAAGTPGVKPDDTKPISIDLNIGPVPIGKFITELINFIILAFAVFIMIVKLVGGAMKRMKKKEAAAPVTTRECPECLSIIPNKARRCSHCTAVVEPILA